MSFRRRNVVLSAATPSPAASLQAQPRQSQQKPEQRGGGPRPGSESKSTVPGLSLVPPPLPDVPRWPLASRPDRSPEELARLAPEKRRLAQALEQAKQQRQQQTMTRNGSLVTPPLGPGARASPFDGRPVTSTGAASLDPLLAGYGGLVLGCSLLVEEQGTTDFASTLLRTYAAEGLVQGHHVHVLGFGHGWTAELPGLYADKKPGSSGKGGQPSAEAGSDKMKIAWRYEALSSRPGAQRQGPPSATASTAAVVFCHAFDITKRLAPADVKGMLHPYALPSPLGPSSSPSSPPSPRPAKPVHAALDRFLVALRQSLDSTPPSSLHRVVLPNFLSPTLYALDGWAFPFVVGFLVRLRSLLRQYGRRITAVVSLSTSLYARDGFYVHQLETLCDNVLELVPLPPGPPSAASRHNSSSSSSSSSSGKESPAEKMQGWCKMHKLQFYSEMGGAGTSPQGQSLRENLCFSLSASKGLVISPYSLPPIEDVGPAERSPAGAAKNNKDGMDF